MAKPPGPGTIVGGRYQLVEVAGRGGMADVWYGRVRGDVGFSRDVAIKQMHAPLASQPAFVAMFVEEARLGASLSSPHLAAVHDLVVDGGNYFMVLEWVEGVDLGAWVRWHQARREAPRWEHVALVAIDILDGLAAVHERVGPDGRPQPVVHRDVSPHNILLTTRGLVKLVDFGLALATDRPQETTDPGVVKGKMSYLAPEIVAGGRPVPASDQFATGSVMWEALVGRKLFDGANDYETFVKLRECQVQPLRPLRPDVPLSFVQAVNRALKADPAERFGSAREMAIHLTHLVKKAHPKVDLHADLARTVHAARAELGLGGASRGAAPPASPLVVAEELPRIAALPQEGEKSRGLLDRLPTLFGRKRGG